jgi:hypothetical protein
MMSRPNRAASLIWNVAVGAGLGLAAVLVAVWVGVAAAFGVLLVLVGAAYVLGRVRARGSAER